MVQNKNSFIYERMKIYRKLAVMYLGGKCQKCGRTEKLHIHHKDGNARNNSIDNLILLCSSCHMKEHGSSKPKKQGKSMGVIYVGINDELEREFRIEVVKRYGGEKGALSRAIEEAIRLWIEEGHK